jgi:hypothetical protein
LGNGRLGRAFGDGRLGTGVWGRAFGDVRWGRAFGAVCVCVRVADARFRSQVRMKSGPLVKFLSDPAAIRSFRTAAHDAQGALCPGVKAQP